MFQEYSCCEKCGGKGAWQVALLGCHSALLCSPCRIMFGQDEKVKKANRERSLCAAHKEWAIRQGRVDQVTFWVDRAERSQDSALEIIAEWLNISDNPCSSSATVLSSSDAEPKE